MSVKKTAEVDLKVLSGRIGKAVLYGTFGLLMFGPAAFGAVEPWSIFVLEAGSVLLALLWVSKQIIDGQIMFHWNPLFLPMAGFAVVLLLQLVLRISAYPHDTISTGMLYCSYALLCFLASQSFLRTFQARKIAVILALYGFAIAAFALLQGVAPNGKLYWIREPRLGGWIYGPYVNHNHYAGLMELLIPIPLVMSLTRLLHHKERMAAGVAAAVMAGTVFLSGSRGGMLALFVEFVVLAALMVRQRKTLRIAIGAVAFAVVLASLLTWLGGKELTQRVSTISTETRTEISGGMRSSIDRDTFRMFLKKPVLGWGLGSFPVVFPQFRSFYTNFFVNEAHDDYVQLLAEMGLVGFATMIWFLIVLYRRSLPKIGIQTGAWMSDVTAAVTLACLLGFTGILVHSLVDFNLQIPANAALFYVWCTLAAAPPLRQRAQRRKPVPTEFDEQQAPLPVSEVV